MVLGENQHLDIDALLMGAVQHHGAEHNIEDGVDHGLHAEQNAAQPVEDPVKDDVQPPDGKAGAPLGEAQPQHIRAAAAGAAGEHDAAAQPHNGAAQQASGEHILHQRRGRDGDQAERQGVNRQGDEAAAQEILAQRAKGQQENGNIEHIVENTGEVIPVGDAEGLIDQRPDQLADTHNPAGVQVQWNQK